MEKMKVIFRKHDGEVIAFMPQLAANYGNIMIYTHMDMHGEASLEFYQATKAALPEEYNSLLNELKSVYCDCVPVVKRRIRIKDLHNTWYNNRQ